MAPMILGVILFFPMHIDLCGSAPEERESPKYWFATASLKIDFLKPTPMDKPVQLRAKIKEMHEKKAVVKCSLYSENEECVRGEVLAIRVPAAAGPMM